MTDRKLFDEESLNMTVNSVSNTARSSNSFTMFSQKKVDDYSTEMNFQVETKQKDTQKEVKQ